MARTSTLEITESDKIYFESLVRSRTIQAQILQRARIILLRAEGIPIDAIADKVGLNRKSVMLCIEKYKDGGAENALYDAPGRGRNPEITDDEKAWIINIACQRPYELGCAEEKWTYTRLASYINKNAEASGYTRLSSISRSSIKNILDHADAYSDLLEHPMRKHLNRSVEYLNTFPQILRTPMHQKSARMGEDSFSVVLLRIRTFKAAVSDGFPHGFA